MVLHLGQPQTQIRPQLGADPYPTGALDLRQYPARQRAGARTIEHNLINELSGYSKISGEVKYGGENSRIDLLLQAENRVNCYIEVKSVTLLQQQRGYFPDAVTLRGQKHLRELLSVVESGQRAVLFFAVLHSGIEQVAPAHHIDERYAALLAQVRQLGVEVVCYGAKLSPDGIYLCDKLPFLSISAAGSL